VLGTGWGGKLVGKNRTMAGTVKGGYIRRHKTLEYLFLALNFTYMYICVLLIKLMIMDMMRHEETMDVGQQAEDI
jgi:hypothetical protein